MDCLLDLLLLESLLIIRVKESFSELSSFAVISVPFEAVPLVT